MKLIAACIVSFLITLVTGRFLLPELRRLKAGQSIREDGPTWHAGKSAPVRVIDGRYLRSDANDTRADNLGDLPPV